MKKILFLILFFASLASFGQVYDYQVQAADILQSDNYFVWKGDTIRKDSIAYLDNHIDSIRVKYINGQFSKWIANSEKIRQWIANNHVSSIAFSGTTTKTMTLNQVNGGTKTAMFTDLDQQTLSTSSSGTTKTITISSGNSISFDVADNDNNSSNEIQAPTKVGNIIGLTQTTTTVDLSEYVNPTTLPTPNSVTFNNSGTGDASGTTFNGSTAKTVSYNTIGAAPASGSGNYIWNGTLQQPASNFNISGNGIANGYLQATTAKLTNLTQGKVPYQNSGALVDSPIFTDGTNISLLGNNTFEFSLRTNDDGTKKIYQSFGSTNYNRVQFEIGGSSLLEGSLLIKTANNGSLHERMAITNIGNVGIGTTNPTRRLFVPSDNVNWISGVFGGAGGNPVVVLGNLSGAATIGGHIDIGLGAWSNLSLNSGGGNVGIGYSTGTEINNNKLAVNGSGYFNGVLTATTAKFTTGATAEYFWKCTNIDGSGGWFPIAASQIYKGTWDASSNTPTLANGDGTTGWYYRCTVAGTVNFGAGNITFAVGDDVSYNGTIWQKIPGQGYTLQPSTASVLGGVKIGSGVTVQTDGTISVSTAYRSDSWVPSWSDITSKPITVSGFGITDAMTTAHAANAITATNISNWNTAYGWGNWASNFGTTAATIAQGNDARINNGQTAFGWGNHASAGYATQSWVSSNFDKYGAWFLKTNGTLYASINSLNYLNFQNGDGISWTASGSTPNIQLTANLNLPGLTTIVNPTQSYYIPVTGGSSNTKILVSTLESILGTTTGTAGRLIMRDGSSDAYAHNFILSSDRRLKKNIIDLPNTDWTNKIEFKQFQFKDDPKEKTRYGVIAQDVEKIAPQLVSTDSEGNKAVAYIDLLIAKIAELEKRIKILENESFKNR